MREVFGFPQYLRRIEALDNVVPAAAQTALYLEGRRLIDRATRWLLQARRSSIDVAGEIERFRSIAELSPLMHTMLQGVERERLDRRAAEFEAMGIPADLALEAAGLLDAFSLLDIVELASNTGEDAQQVGLLYFTLSESFEVDRMLSRITALPRDDRWAALARMALRYDLYGAHAGLTRSVLTATPSRAERRRSASHLVGAECRGSGQDARHVARDGVHRRVRPRDAVSSP